jgi:hypothetical protein
VIQAQSPVERVWRNKLAFEKRRFAEQSQARLVAE